MGGSTASAGSAPAASLKPECRIAYLVALGEGGIRGVCPRGLIEARAGIILACDIIPGIRGVCPRGLIEACPSMGLHPSFGGIRGVCPRGLIEAARPSFRSRRRFRAGIRGVCPRGLIEAVVAASHDAACRRRIRGVCPRGLIEAPLPAAV